MSLHRNLLRNLPIDWIVPVYCANLEEFLDIKNWSEVLGILFLDVDNIELSIDTSDPKIQWQIYCQALFLHIDKIQQFFQITFKDNQPLLNGYNIVLDGKEIGSLEWKVFLNYVVQMYKLDWNTLQPPKTKNKALQKMRDKINANKAKAQKIKEKEGRAVTVETMINGLIARDPSLNFLNIFQLNYYQFITTLESNNNVETFDYSRQALLQGADPKKVKIKHWTEG